MHIFMGFGPVANFSQTTKTRKCIILYGKQVDKSKFRTFPVCTDNQLILLVTRSILTGVFFEHFKASAFLMAGFSSVGNFERMKRM